MKWWHRLLDRQKHSRNVPVETTQPELNQERQLRVAERKRTDRMEQVLADYRAQDRALRR